MDKKMSLVEHLSELRTTIIIMMSALLICSFVGYCLSSYVLNLIKEPLPNKTLSFFGPAEAFMTYLRLSVVTGAVLSFPVALSSLAWFIGPGLTKREKKIIRIIILLAILLFAAGLIFTHLLALPLILNFLFRVTNQEMLPFISIHSYVSFVLSLYIVFGLGFETPILMFFLLKWEGAHLVLGRLRKLIIAALLTCAFLFSPGTDFFTQFLLLLPIYLLFEGTVLISKLYRRYSQTKEGGDNNDKGCGSKPL